LVRRSGDALRELPRVVEEIDATAVYLTRSHEPWVVAVEAKLKATFEHPVSVPDGPAFPCRLRARKNRITSLRICRHVMSLLQRTRTKFISNN
jgi:hypothetical protein